MSPHRSGWSHRNPVLRMGKGFRKQQSWQDGNGQVSRVIACEQGASQAEERKAAATPVPSEAKEPFATFWWPRHILKAETWYHQER